VVTSGRNENRKQHFLNLFRHFRCVYVSHDYLFKVILPHPLVKENSECSGLVLDVTKLAFDGTEECFFSQSPRNCLKTHEDVIVVCRKRKHCAMLPLKTSGMLWLTCLVYAALFVMP